MSESTQIKTKQRDSGIELLRILMMLQIIFQHVSQYGGYYKHALALGGKHTLLYWILWLMSRCPVYMFIVIMGYFLIDATQDSVRKRILKVYVPMYVYAVAIPIVIRFTGVMIPEKKDYIRGFFPALSRTWYFMTLYLIILILSPYLNKLIHSLTKKEYLMLLAILFFIFSIWNSIAHLKPFDEVIGVQKIIETEEGKSLYDFIFMYFLGGFLKKYQFRKDGTLLWWRNFMNLAMFLLLGLLDTFILYLYPSFRAVIGYNDNPLVVLQCIFLFRFFSNLEFHSEIINIISACNLGIYMLHEHPLLRNILWNKIVRMNYDGFYATPIYIVNIFLIIISIYCGCFLIELARQQIAHLFHFLRRRIKREGGSV